MALALVKLAAAERWICTDGVSMGCVDDVASGRKSGYIRPHALLPPHLAIALHVQPDGCATAARRALTIPPHIGFKAGGTAKVAVSRAIALEH